jgi:hypothetical protein
MVTQTGFSGTAVVRLGIYNNSSTDEPSTVFYDAGTVSPTAAVVAYEITISQTLSQGWYWLAINCQTAATSNIINGIQSGSGSVGMTGSSGIGSGVFGGYQESVNVTSGFATAGTLTGTPTPLLVYLRK